MTRHSFRCPRVGNRGFNFYKKKEGAIVLWVRFLPIKCSTERLQQSFSCQACPERSRRNSKSAKKNIFLFLRTWRPLWFDFAHHPESIEGRLCGSPRGIPTRPRSSCSPETLFHRARPVEYLLDRKYIGFALKLFHRASHRFSDFLNPLKTQTVTKSRTSLSPLPFSTFVLELLKIKQRAILTER